MSRSRSEFISGAKVFLRPPQPNDCAELILLNRRSVRLHRGFASTPKTVEEFNEYLERAKKTDTECFLICRKANSAIAGTINLSQIFRGGFQNAYLGYYIGEPFASQGLMSEAVRLMLRHAFKTIKLHRLEANIQPENLRSITLVRNAGFTREGYSRYYLKIGGRWRDHERWAITVEGWKNHSASINVSGGRNK
jgi:ribosomal-protein-alanine N-acetyltransferase